MKYNHQKVERKWQEYWEKHKTFKTTLDTNKPKYYVLDMFPYPSGAGLHVGHAEGYTATDIIARYKRAKGFNVLHPMGWDSFGLPAEQYAIRTGTHPSVSTKKNIDNYRRQMKSIGLSYDWDREFATSDPKYYKWTQWIFTKLYEKGLAYEAEILVNFCPALGTVLANEEVENGKAIEGGYPIERRPLKQWVLKITAYAERLLEDLEGLDWPESLKKLQINWIGKSEGAHIHFIEKTTEKPITVFTTRPDTLFGVSYMVLAPEHPLVAQIATETQKEAVREYQKHVAGKSDLERTELNTEKTGVFTGAYALHPITSALIPIWISDYVLLNYGTGAVMAVPAHDERDFAFAKKFHLPIKFVYKTECEDTCCTGEESTVVNSSHQDFTLNGMNLAEAKDHIIAYLEKKGKGKKSVTYKLRDWLFSRQRYWGEPFPVLKFDDGSVRLLTEDELPLLPPEINNYKPSPTGESPLARVKEWVEVFDNKTGRPAHRDTHIMPQWAGSCWYYLRFCDPHNTHEAWDKATESYWLPVDLYVGGVEHAVLHLLYARFWHKVLYDCGLVTTKEPFQSLRNQGLIVARSYQNQQHGYVEPENVQEINGKYIDKRTGEELKSQIDKMSKSKLNGTTPDDVIEEFGADSLRLYEMFMGPLEKEKIWNTDGVSGCRRFLNRFFDMVTSDKVTEEENPEALKYIHRLVDGVTRDLEGLQFNTAIAKMMEFINNFTKLSSYPKSSLKMAVQVLAPFAPHISEEMWHLLGMSESLSYTPFPVANESYLYDESVTYVVQINGKVRGRFDLPKGVSQDKILELARQNPHVEHFIQGKEILKVIFVPDKLLNIVV